MKVSEIRQKGRELGLTGLSAMRKADMIRAIQLKEGNSDCFGSPGRFDCLQFDCCWRSDCLTRKPG